MNTEEITTRVQQLLEKTIQVKLTDKNTDLVESGMIDSLSLIEFIVALENEFKIEISFDNLDFKHFKNLDEISRQVINSKLKAEK